MEEWIKTGIKNGLKRSLRYLGFEWNRKYRVYLKKNSTMTLDELVHVIGIDKKEGKNSGLEAYCGQVAYRQTMNGIPNTFSVPEMEVTSKASFSSTPGMEKFDGEKYSDTKPDILSSKPEGGPYSKVEQLERLIDLRKKGEISSEEFDSLKKELLS